MASERLTVKITSPLISFVITSTIEIVGTIGLIGSLSIIIIFSSLEKSTDSSNDISIELWEKDVSEKNPVLGLKTKL